MGCKTWTVKNSKIIPNVISDAFSLAMKPRRGPLCINLPRNILAASNNYNINTNKISFKYESNLKGKIEKIKKDNKSWEENIEIGLYTAIALAIKNNKELKIKLLESAMANRQIDKVRFEMLPSFAANAGYTGSERYNATARALSLIHI